MGVWGHFANRANSALSIYGNFQKANLLVPRKWDELLALCAIMSYRKFNAPDCDVLFCSCLCRLCRIGHFLSSAKHMLTLIGRRIEVSLQDDKLFPHTGNSLTASLSQKGKMAMHEMAVRVPCMLFPTSLSLPSVCLFSLQSSSIFNKFLPLICCIRSHCDAVGVVISTCFDRAHRLLTKSCSKTINGEHAIREE